MGKVNFQKAVKYGLDSGFRHGFKNVIFSKFFFGFVTSISVLLSSHDKAGRIKDNIDAKFNEQEDTFDFVIVGGGTAGSLLANRLSESHKVLLLEAGGEPHPLQRIPGMSLFMLNHEEIDWMHRTVPQRRACFASPRRRASWCQGLSLGGTSNLDFMMHLRGSPRDYDHWAKITGDESWSYEALLPYFRRFENYQGDSPDREAHGFDGEMKLEVPAYTGMAKEFIRAGQELGYEHVDLNARYDEGFDTIYSPMEGGDRRSVFTAFLEPCRDRETLVIRKYAHVNKLLIRGHDNTAYGVEYDRHGRTKRAYATKEVILAAGTIESAKLLMMAGIGPKSHLADLGIPLVSNLPVGKNLQDHMATILGPFFIDPPRAYLIDRDVTLKSFYEYKSDGLGPMSSSLFQAAAMMSSKKNKWAGQWNWPDIQLLLSGMAGHKTFAADMAHAFNLNPKLIRKYYNHALGRDSFFIAVTASRPYARGEVVLEKKDPYAPMSINPRYLENDHDMGIMTEGIKTALYLVENTTSFQDLRARFTNKKFPGCEHMAFRSDDYFECYARHFSVSLNNFVGTCAMGQPHMGTDGVVDAELQVIGVNHLRVVDASVIPTIPGAPTQAAVLVIAEKAADIIIEAWKIRGQAVQGGWHPGGGDEPFIPHKLKDEFGGQNYKPPMNEGWNGPGPPPSPPTGGPPPPNNGPPTDGPPPNNNGRPGPPPYGSNNGPPFGPPDGPPPRDPRNNGPPRNYWPPSGSEMPPEFNGTFMQSPYPPGREPPDNNGPPPPNVMGPPSSNIMMNFNNPPPRGLMIMNNMNNGPPPPLNVFNGPPNNNGPPPPTSGPTPVPSASNLQSSTNFPNGTGTHLIIGNNLDFTNKPTRFDEEIETTTNRARPDNGDTNKNGGYRNRAEDKFRMQYPIVSSLEYPNKVPTMASDVMMGSNNAGMQMPIDPPTTTENPTPSPFIMFKSTGTSNRQVPSTANIPDIYYKIKDGSSLTNLQFDEDSLLENQFSSSMNVNQLVKVPNPYWTNAIPTDYEPSPISSTTPNPYYLNASPTTFTTPKPKHGKIMILKTVPKKGRVVRIKSGNVGVSVSTPMPDVHLGKQDPYEMMSESTLRPNKIKIKIKHNHDPYPVKDDKPQQGMDAIQKKTGTEMPGPITITPRPMLSVTIWPKQQQGMWKGRNNGTINTTPRHFENFKDISTTGKDSEQSGTYLLSSIAEATMDVLQGRDPEADEDNYRNQAVPPSFSDMFNFGNWFGSSNTNNAPNTQTQTPSAPEFDSYDNVGPSFIDQKSDQAVSSPYNWNQSLNFAQAQTQRPPWTPSPAIIPSDLVPNGFDSRTNFSDLIRNRYTHKEDLNTWGTQWGPYSSTTDAVPQYAYDDNPLRAYSDYATPPPIQYTSTPRPKQTTHRPVMMLQEVNPPRAPPPTTTTLPPNFRTRFRSFYRANRKKQNYGRSFGSPEVVNQVPLNEQDKDGVKVIRREPWQGIERVKPVNHNVATFANESFNWTLAGGLQTSQNVQDNVQYQGFGNDNQRQFETPPQFGTNNVNQEQNTPQYQNYDYPQNPPQEENFNPHPDTTQPQTLYLEGQGPQEYFNQAQGNQNRNSQSQRPIVNPFRSNNNEQRGGHSTEVNGDFNNFPNQGQYYQQGENSNGPSQQQGQGQEEQNNYERGQQQFGGQGPHLKPLVGQLQEHNDGQGQIQSLGHPSNPNTFQGEYNNNNNGLTTEITPPLENTKDYFDTGEYNITPEPYNEYNVGSTPVPALREADLVSLRYDHTGDGSTLDQPVIINGDVVASSNLNGSVDTSRISITNDHDSHQRVNEEGNSLQGPAISQVPQDIYQTQTHNHTNSHDQIQQILGIQIPGGSIPQQENPHLHLNATLVQGQFDPTGFDFHQDSLPNPNVGHHPFPPPPRDVHFESQIVHPVPHPHHHPFSPPIGLSNPTLYLPTLVSTTAKPVLFGSKHPKTRDPFAAFGDTFTTTQLQDEFYDHYYLPQEDEGIHEFNNARRTFKSINSTTTPMTTARPNPKEYTIYSDPDTVDITTDEPMQINANSNYAYKEEDESKFNRRFTHMRRRADILRRRRGRNWRQRGRFNGRRFTDSYEDEDEEGTTLFRRRRNRRPFSRRRYKEEVENYPFRRRSSQEEEYEQVPKPEHLSGQQGMNETMKNSLDNPIVPNNNEYHNNSTIPLESAIPGGNSTNTQQNNDTKSDSEDDTTTTTTTPTMRRRRRMRNGFTWDDKPTRLNDTEAL